MTTAAKVGKMVVRAADSVLNFIVLLAVLLLLLFGCYAMWDSGRVYSSADSARYAVYKPTADTASGPSFSQLQAINPEVFSWLTVYGTHIDYPVVQGADNLKYINTDALGGYSLSGAIFLDAGCSEDF